MSRYRKKYKLEEVINYDSLYLSYRECKLGKMWKDSVIDFDLDPYVKLTKLNEECYNSTYVPKDFYHTQINERGKVRDICSLHFRDRIVQKCVNQRFMLNSFFPSFIPDNFASLKDRGTDKALQRLKEFMLESNQLYGYNNYYILKTDIHHYFDSLLHERCLNSIEPYTDDPRLMNIFVRTFQKYYEDPVIAGGQPIPVGVGLGGELPQTFGVQYLDEFDHYIKEHYHIKYYLRYMDDAVMISPYKELLEQIVNEMSVYLSSIGLCFSPNKTIINKSNLGVKFLKLHFYPMEDGYVIMKLDNKNKARGQKKLIKLAGLVDDGQITADAARQSFKSWEGSMLRGNNKAFIDKIEAEYNKLFIENWHYEHTYEEDLEAYASMIREVEFDYIRNLPVEWPKHLFKYSFLYLEMD